MGDVRGVFGRAVQISVYAPENPDVLGDDGRNWATEDGIRTASDAHAQE